MESIEGGMDAPNTITIEAAVTDIGNDSTTAAVSVADADISAQDDVNGVAVKESFSPVSPLDNHQTTSATGGEGEADVVATNQNSDDFSPNNEEAALNNDTDTAAATTNNEETIEENIETDAFTSNNNDMDLLGFTDGGGAEMMTQNQAEILLSFPENNNIVETAVSSNDFDLLGFGVEEKPQEEEELLPPISDDNTATDENNDNEVNATNGTEDGENNDVVTSPDSEAVVDEAPMTETQEIISSSDLVPNQGDTVEDDLLNTARTNDDEKNDVTSAADSETVDQTQTETVKTTTSDAPNQSGAIEDLLSLASNNEPSATVVTLPESTESEVDSEDSTQLNSKEATTINGYASEAVVDEAPITETQEITSSSDLVPNQGDAVEDDLLNTAVTSDGENNDVTSPDSETVDQTQTETVKTTSSDVPNQSGAVEDLLSLASNNEPSATVVTLPESTDNEVNTEDSTQLNSEEVTIINGDASEVTDAQPNDESSLPVSSSGSTNIATEEATEGSNSDNNVSDAKDNGVDDGVDDAQTSSVETKIDTVDDMSPPPRDEPSATIIALPESTGNILNEESTQLNVDINNINIDVTPATEIQPNEVVNTDIQEDMQQEEEDGEGFQTIEENDESGMTPVLNEEVTNPIINASAEAHTEEEAEWLSMGLSLGDALRQIVALTDERDSALAFCQEKDDIATQAESLLVEVQARLEAEMNRRAESDSKARKLLETMKAYEARLEAYEKMEDDLEATQANLVRAVSEKSQLELEIAKLREVRDESERKEAVLSNRLNEAKKKEANKSHTAGRLELDNEELRANLESTKAELESVSKAKTKLEGTMEKLKTKAVERVKQAETALKEERELNEERKKKMKVFVETKAEELREAKESAGDMQKELQETRASLTASREREESMQKELTSARIKYREVQRDMERMKRNAEALHDMGNNLEQELEKSANETEEHKKKRISAKHELMTMMRTLEVERGVSEKLRESMKFTFAPKAQSQQQLLSECLRDLEQELDRLSMKLGKSLLPQSQTNDSGHAKIEEGMERSESNGSGKKARKGRAAKADMDTERLISNLEQETQLVSKGIMALVSSIERMRVLLDEDNSFNCMAFLSHFGLTMGPGEARHQRLGGEAPADDREETMSITSFEQR